MYLSPFFAWLQFTLVEAEMISDQERDKWFFYETRGKKKNFYEEEKKEGCLQKSKNWPIPISLYTSKTTQRKNIAQSNNNNNTNTNNKNNNIKEEEEEQHFFDEDCHVVPEYVPVELIDANDVEQVSELYSSVNTGVEFFPSAAATTANVYVPTAKSQKRSSFEDFLGEFIGYEETIDDAIVPTF